MPSGRFVGSKALSTSRSSSLFDQPQLIEHPCSVVEVTRREGDRPRR
jgi:hypothetical protein